MSTARYRLTEIDIDDIIKDINFIVSYKNKPITWNTYTDRDKPTEQELASLKNMTLGNLHFGKRYKHPKAHAAFDIFDDNGNTVAFSDRAAKNRELRGETLRNYILRERERNPDANLFDTLKHTTSGIKGNHVFTATLTPLRDRLGNRFLPLNLTAVLMCEQGFKEEKFYNINVRSDRNFVRTTFNELSTTTEALEKLTKRLDDDTHATPACTALRNEVNAINELIQNVISGYNNINDLKTSLTQASDRIKNDIFKTRHQIALKIAFLKIVNVLIAIFTVGIAHGIHYSKTHKNKFFSDTIDSGRKNLANYKTAKILTGSWKSKKK